MKFSCVPTILWVTKASAKWWREYRNATPGLAFAALWAEYVSQCLTCQHVRDKPGDVRFHLKNIQSGYFNELVQYDHMKLCPTDDGNTGILVINGHFSKFAEAVPCSHDEYDAITTSRLLLQKWFARHGTPTRMQSDNAPNLTAEVSNELMKASQVTKVTSTAGHPPYTRHTRSCRTPESHATHFVACFPFATNA